MKRFLELGLGWGPLISALVMTSMLAGMSTTPALDFMLAVVAWVVAVYAMILAGLLATILWTTSRSLRNPEWRSKWLRPYLARCLLLITLFTVSGGLFWLWGFLTGISFFGGK
jgi:anaerobic C4-dicarboxylate transporter